MTADGPHMEVTYNVEVKADVRADLRARLRIDRSAVAAYHEVHESEVTDKMVTDYVEDGDAYELELEDFDLEDVVDWDTVRGRVLTKHEVRVTPPGWVPLWDEEHEHTDRGNRDMCQAGRCYLDTIVPRAEPLAVNSQPEG